VPPSANVLKQLAADFPAPLMGKIENRSCIENSSEVNEGWNSDNWSLPMAQHSQS